MKTLKLLIASLLLVTQSYAFSKSERNLLLGLGAGALVVAALNAKDVHITKVHHPKRVYVDSYNDRRIHNKKQARREHRREIKREHRRAEKHYRSHHRDNHRYSRHDRRHNKHYKRHNRSHHAEYAYNNSRHNYRY